MLLVSAAVAQQQDKGLSVLSLNDLSAFRQQAGNWSIVGTVTIDPSVEIHHQEAPAAPAPKKKQKDVAPVPAPVAVTSTPGTGILLNMNDDKRRSHLLTVMEHGDIEIDLELMVPKGSNSGLYLQGRYEVQILDSWGVKTPAYSDIGGIYRNWENQPGKIYMGKAPLTNAAKAPGLWQRLHVVFQAPRFDGAGKKIANAKFLAVDLNGVRIHDNLEVPLPTGGPIENNEVAAGPIMIQGDHGPVAFRNIRYRALKDVKTTISPVSYHVHHGNFKSFNDFASRKPDLSGTSPELSAEVIDVEDVYGVDYSGTITVPQDGRYEFGLAFTGGAQLSINGTVVVDHPGTDDWDLDISGIDLKAGTHPFRILNYKDAGWMPPRLALYARIESGKEYPLHAYNSYPPDPNPVASIHLAPGAEPRLLRAFVDFNGDRSRRLTHTIGVGDPCGTHYIYDLGSGALSCVWKGGFVDATPMWHDRGDGSFRPLGAAQYTFTGQPLAFLPDVDEAFPATATEEYRSLGYEVDPSSGRPTFRYRYKGLEVTAKVIPEREGRILTHEVSVRDRGTAPSLYLKLAEGSVITPVPDGSWSIDDKRYYIRVNGGGTAQVRSIGGKQELMIPVGSSPVSYSIIW